MEILKTISVSEKLYEQGVYICQAVLHLRKRILNLSLRNLNDYMNIINERPFNLGVIFDQEVESGGGFQQGLNAILASKLIP